MDQETPKNTDSSGVRDEPQLMLWDEPPEQKDDGVDRRPCCDCLLDEECKKNRPERRARAIEHLPKTTCGLFKARIRDVGLGCIWAYQLPEHEGCCCPQHLKALGNLIDGSAQDGVGLPKGHGMYRADSFDGAPVLVCSGCNYHAQIPTNLDALRKAVAMIDLAVVRGAVDMRELYVGNLTYLRIALKSICDEKCDQCTANQRRHCARNAIESVPTQPKVPDMKEATK